MAKDTTITRSVALKASVDLFSRRTSYSSEDILKMSEKFNEWLCKAEEPQKENKQFKEDNRDWLTEQQKNQMMDQIKKGNVEDVKEAMKKYRMKKIYREELTKAMQPVIF